MVSCCTAQYSVDESSSSAPSASHRRLPISSSAAIWGQVFSLMKSLCHLRHRSTLRTWLLTSLWRSLQRWPDSALRRLLWFARYTARILRRWMIRRISPVRPVPLEPCFKKLAFPRFPQASGGDVNNVHFQMLHREKGYSLQRQKACWSIGWWETCAWR